MIRRKLVQIHGDRDNLRKKGDAIERNTDSRVNGTFAQDEHEEDGRPDEAVCSLPKIEYS